MRISVGGSDWYIEHYVGHGQGANSGNRRAPCPGCQTSHHSDSDHGREHHPHVHCWCGWFDVGRLDFGIGRYYPEGKHFKQDGYLYNWYAVDDLRGLAPKGWHVPSQEEFEELESFLKSNSAFWYDGVSDAIGKSLASKDGWADSDDLWAIGTNPELNNYTKFNAYPIGPWLGTSYRRGYFTYFWSATECSRRDRDAYYWRLDYNRYVFNNFPNIKAYGFSVRCIKD